LVTLKGRALVNWTARCARVSPDPALESTAGFRSLSLSLSVFVSACSAVKSPFAMAKAIRCPSQPSVTTTSLLRTTKYSPRGPHSLVDRRREPSTCGIGDDGDRHGRSLLHARQVRGRLIGQTVDDDKLPRLPRVSPESGDAPHRRVTSSGSQRGMMIDARPASELLGFTALPHHGSGESGEAIVRSS
jgi:hypothetical protein